MENKPIELPSRAHATNLAGREVREPEADPAFAATLARGLKVLGAFRAGDASLTNAELSARTGLSKSSVSRLTRTLVLLGHLEPSSKGGFALAARVLATAYPLLAGLTIRQRARPQMREFAASVGGAVSLAMIAGLNAIYVETLWGSQSTSHLPDIGFEVPLVQTSIGRALLSLLDDGQRSRVLEAVQARYPDLWNTYSRNVLIGIQSCKTRGFCVSLGEWRKGMYGASSPLAHAHPEKPVAIICGFPAYAITPERLENEIGPRLAALAASLDADISKR